MKLLRRVLYWEAGVLGVSGAAAAAFPRLVVVNLFGQVPYPEYAWVRIAGIQAVGLALLMVLVAQRLERLWWFSWAFVFTAAGTATALVLNAAVGLPQGSAAWFWWLFSAVAVGFTAGLLWGMAHAGNERPADLTE